MSDIRKLYLRGLASYLHSESEQSLQEASVLGKVLQTYRLEEIIKLHEESIHTLVANVDSDEAVKMYHLSFVFLMEITVGYRNNSSPSDEGGHQLTDLLEMLRKSYSSFQNVKNKYENVLQYMDIGIIIFDSEGFISFINVQMSKILGVPRRKLLGCDLPCLLRHPSLSREKRRTIRNIYHEIAYRRNRYLEITDDDRQLLLNVKCGDDLDGDILISMKDVTEYKQIEQTAYQNDKLAMLGKIAASIAHEVRNPLTSIRGFVQLLQPSLREIGKAEYGEIILSEIDRANNIIFEFLNSSKPTAPNKQSIMVRSLLKEAAMLSESEALLKNCVIEIGTIDPGIFVSVDVKQIKQVILNVIKNAVDAISEVRKSGGRISLECRRTGETVEIMIIDNGKGMDERTKARLFDPFFTTKEEGTGLGLSVCHRIIKNHGGFVRVDSVLNEGTSFILQLPIASENSILPNKQIG